MTYGLTVDGFVKKTFANILDELEDSCIENIHGLTTRDRLSVLGHLNTNDAQELSELWEVAQAIYAAQNRDESSGISLQYVASLTGTYLTGYSKTVVKDVTVTLNPNTTLPAGSVANLEGQSSIRFVTLTEIAADEIGGDYVVDFEAEEEGAIVVSADQLNEIAEPITGWIAVNNDNAGTTGNRPETDPELRVKAELELSASGSTNIDAIRASIIRETDCTACLVLQNDTDLVDDNLIPPHTIWVICKDGTSVDIAQTIFTEKAAGIRSKGVEIETVTDLQGDEHEERFDYATEIEVDINYIFYVLDGYDFDSVDTVIVQMFTDYFSQLDVGENVIYGDLYCLLRNIEGINLEVGFDFYLNETTLDITVQDYQIAILGNLTFGE